MENRITQAEKELRLYYVYELVLNGYPRYKIIEFGRNEWKASDRTIDGYIAEVADMMKNENTKNFEYNFNLMNSRIESLIVKCNLENDKKTLVNLLRLQAEINGLKKDRVEISGEMSIKNIEIIIKDGLEDTSNESI